MSRADHTSDSFFEFFSCYGQHTERTVIDESIAERTFDLWVRSHLEIVVVELIVLKK